MPKRSPRNRACVPLPAPGGPNSTMATAGTDARSGAAILHPVLASVKPVSYANERRPRILPERGVKPS